MARFRKSLVSFEGFCDAVDARNIDEADHVEDRAPWQDTSGGCAFNDEIEAWTGRTFFKCPEPSVAVADDDLPF